MLRFKAYVLVAMFWSRDRGCKETMDLHPKSPGDVGLFQKKSLFCLLSVHLSFQMSLKNNRS